VVHFYKDLINKAKVILHSALGNSDCNNYNIFVVAHLKFLFLSCASLDHTCSNTHYILIFVCNNFNVIHLV
jgi:hypothetical protein